MSEHSRRKKSLSPDHYANLISGHAGRSLTTSSFLGTNYIGFSNWLQQDSQQFLSESPQIHALVVLLDVGREAEATHYFTQDKVKDFLEVPFPQKEHVQVLFIRGFLSPPWVSAIGSHCGIDPGYFLRHLSFLTASVYRHLYGLPSLVTSSDNIMRLIISTIICQDISSSSAENTRDRHLHEVDGLATYKRQLRTRARCGDSLVREYWSLNSRFSILEQWVSICISSTGQVTIWTDQGRDLGSSPSGPWSSNVHQKASAFPVIQHHPKMTFRDIKQNAKFSNDLPPLCTPKSTQGASKPMLPQSGTLLPLEYESLLALGSEKSRSSHPSLTATLMPLLMHAAFSEVQFLNLMEEQIVVERDESSNDSENDPVANLQYYSDGLDRHARQLRDNIRILRKYSEIDNGSKAKLSKQQKSNAYDWASDFLQMNSTFTVNGVLEDYEELYARATALSEQCKVAISVIMNQRMIQESKQALQQSDRIKKLTVLATFFIPLGFSASLFSMDLELLERDARKLWWYFVICIPTTTVAWLFFLWDYAAVKRTWSERIMRRNPMIRHTSIGE